MNSRVNGLATSLMILALPCLAAVGPVIPGELPRPDDKPGNPQKPVKVYILAGQSNMVGMGDIAGARPEYPSVFLSADPAILPGPMPIGTERKRSACKWQWGGISALDRHGVFQSAAPDAKSGAIVAVHKGAYDPKADYSKLEPAKTATVALGTVDAAIPELDVPCTAVATAFIDVPVSGHYTLHVGFGESTHAIAVLDGKEAYRREPGAAPVVTKVALDAGRCYPLQITYLKGGSAALWLEQVDLKGKGDLVTQVKENKAFPYLIGDDCNWTVRNDVIYKEARIRPENPGVPLSATANGNTVGPELGFGFVMGTYHDEQVLLIKTANGNRSLNWDFRPPSSGTTGSPDAAEWEGLEYRLMIKGVHDTLNKIADYVPGYAGQGYEIAGFGWFQGHKDSGLEKAEYEKHLVNLINDLRKEFKVPAMPVVVATVGFHGYRLPESWKGVWEAQMAVGDPGQHPEFAGTVMSVDTRDFWREVDESPRNQDYHYNRNPETYLLVGEAMGRSMVRMQGGQAVEIPKSDREQRAAAAIAAEAARPVPTEAQEAASLAAIRPMLLDGLLPAFLNNPRTQKALQAIVTGTKPAKPSDYLDDVFDDIAAYYQTAGMDTYNWKPFGENIKEGVWQYFAFDLPSSPYKGKTAASAEGESGDEEGMAAATSDKPKAAAVEVTLPPGLETWTMPEFDVKKAGWQSGQAPFGMMTEEMLPTNIAWITKYPIYPLKRTLPKTTIENDVLLMRKTIEVPPLKEGHRYRIRLDGSIHANSGEGYAIYVNGKLLVEQKNGVTAWRKQSARGYHIGPEFRDAFKGGKVTIAVANFPMSNYTGEFIPAIGPLSVWVEEMKTEKIH